MAAIFESPIWVETVQEDTINSEYRFWEAILFVVVKPAMFDGYQASQDSLISTPG